MKKYYVTLISEQHGVIDEDYVLKTDDADKAIKTARYFADRTSSAKVEIRMYTDDIEDEDCNCFDYDTLDFQQEDEPEEPERIQDITSSAAALYDGGWRFYDRDNLIKEYNLHPDDADAICEKLLEYDK